MGMFQLQNLVIQVPFSTLTALVVFRARKVVKIRLKHFSVVLMGNDRNCTLNRVCIFRVQNHVIQTQFSTLLALVVFGLGKVVKIRPKHFSVVLTRNGKNCTPNRVGTFRVQNRVIRAWFSTLPARGLLGGVRARKIRPKYFSVVLMKKDKYCTLNSVSIFQVPKRVIRA